MFRLFYVSTAAPDFTPGDIKPLVETASAKNRELGITGALKFNGINFAQVLEGEKDAVLRLMSTIRYDKRHTGVIVVAEAEADDRMFGHWDMSFVDGLDFQDFVNAMSSREKTHDQDA
ncbi:BLUF domain-containing protein [Pseudohoeflea suaedae]|uniref:BLUF domain-containing protein n=1 Tax=Pseudohoeflea suaedae TaxID=877384 RepID=A0A4R5PN22_9HYPH|nr:BLUF domain-containing protein [Pseudohoeflea suaedae]TDH38339.1 BLUF domain-containing protein [Pseudohoeflea suaedae]